MSDLIAFCLFGTFMLLLMSFGVTNSFSRYMCQNYGTKCIWCKKIWVGLGCACIARSKVGRNKSPGSKAWQESDLDERLYYRMRYCQSKYLKARREGFKQMMWCWQWRRDAYLESLGDYQECRKRGVYR